MRWRQHDVNPLNIADGGQSIPTAYGRSLSQMNLTPKLSLPHKNLLFTPLWGVTRYAPIARTGITQRKLTTGGPVPLVPKVGRNGR